MNPLVLARFGTRIGPFLGRVASSTPGLLAKLITRLRAGGAVVGDKLDDVIRWAKANPVNAALIASTLASMGFAVSDLFKGAEDDETKSFARDLEALAAKARSRSSEMIADIGDDSESKFFKRDSDDEVASRELLKRTLRWARDNFGGEKAAMLAHQYIQVFSEIPADVVAQGYADYDLSRVKL